MPAENAPIRIDVPIEQSVDAKMNESKTHMKCGKALSYKDKILRKVILRDQNQ